MTVDFFTKNIECVFNRIMSKRPSLEEVTELIEGLKPMIREFGDDQDRAFLDEHDRQERERLDRKERELLGDGHFIDLSVFEDDGKAESCSESGTEEDIVNHCKSLKRLAVALKYYETLRFIGCRESEDGISIFADFIETVYSQYLDDLIHLKRDHLSDLGLIQRNLLQNEGFHECDGSRCCGAIAVGSNHWNATKSKTKGKDKKDKHEGNEETALRVLAQTFDSVQLHSL